MQKRIIALLLVLALVIEIPVMCHEKGKAYATGAELVVAGTAILGGLAAVSAAAVGIVNIGKKAGEVIGGALTPEEEEEYYSSVSSNNVEAVKKLYQDGYFDADEDMKSVIGSLVEGDDTSCSVSLEKFMEDKGMTAENDLKVYDQKHNDGDDKKVFAPSKELLTALADGIKDAIGRMLEEKKKEVAEQPTYPFTMPENASEYGNYYITTWVNQWGYVEYNLYLFGFNPIKKERREIINTFKKDGISSYLFYCNYYEIYKWMGTRWDYQIGSGGDHNYLMYVDAEGETLLFSNCIFKFDNSICYDIKEFGLPTSVTSTEIVNNYFSEQNITYNEDIYNYETNNFFTEEKYLLPADPADLGRDVLVPASQTIINNYNSLDTDVTLDYINNVVIPTIITDINANLNTNTDLILKYLNIDNVIDFSGTVGEDTWNGVTFFGLEKKFPFCLPFDFVRFLSILDAEPRAPCITVTIPFSSLGIAEFEDYTITFDFSQYNEIAELVRTLELFGGVLGLILLTKKLLF